MKVNIRFALCASAAAILWVSAPAHAIDLPFGKKAGTETEVTSGGPISDCQGKLRASVATLQNWEQGRRRPEGPARALLKIAAENPEAVEAALGT